MGALSRMTQVVASTKRTKVALLNEIEALKGENRVMQLQLARLQAERTMLQELSRQLQNINQSQSIMLGEVINNAAGMLTDEGVTGAVRALASTVKTVVPTAVDDVINRLAYTDERTQGVIAAPERSLAARARVVNDD